MDVMVVYRLGSTYGLGLCCWGFYVQVYVDLYGQVYVDVYLCYKCFYIP